MMNIDMIIVRTRSVYLLASNCDTLLFKKFKTDLDWIVVAVDSEVLYKKDCIFVKLMRVVQKCLINHWMVEEERKLC